MYVCFHKDLGSKGSAKFGQIIKVLSVVSGTYNQHMIIAIDG